MDSIGIGSRVACDNLRRMKIRFLLATAVILVTSALAQRDLSNVEIKTLPVAKNI
jgi:hypothetical protein